MYNHSFLDSKLKITLFIMGILLLILLLIFIIGYVYLVNYKNPSDSAMADAGVMEKTAKVGNVTFNYAEGPNNGPALLLLHAQLLDWYTYSKVFPQLAQNFHVFAVDYPGHGKTTYPDDYTMSADQIGEDLAVFIQTVIQEPVFATGNSSGGLLTTWLAANEPDLIKAVVLEDPPLFSAEYPEIKNTIAYKAFTTSFNAVQEGYKGDFLGYWITNSTEFFKRYTGPISQQLIEFAVNSYKKSNPERPVEIAFVPASVQEMLRGLNYYDPRFGTAFYDGTWNNGFSHKEALESIECPVLLLHANFEIMENGTLNGAMSEQQADLAASLLKSGEIMRVDSSHVINLENPEQFVKILEDFFLDK